MAKRIMEDLVFNQMLCSEGFKIEYAVGTTYSLDLDSFIALPFSLGFLEEPDELMKKSLNYICSALTVCKDNLAVFCNYSDIKAPQGSSKIICSLLEDCIFGINASKKKDTIVNFHPKVWVIQEKEHNGTKKQIKVIVMSRNLTGDNSLDIVCELVGQIQPKEASQKSKAKHKPLCDFLHYLSKHASQSKRKIINQIIDSIQYIKSFETDGVPFDDYDFLPMGFANYDGNEQLEEMTNPYEAIVVSPFIDDKTLNAFNNARNFTLITQELSITQKTMDLFGTDNIYIVNQNMIDNEENESVDLHAKIYYIKRRGDYSQYVYLGSTNATQNGFSRNVEFLLRLKYAPNYGSYHTFRENFINDDKDCKFTKMICLTDNTSSTLEEYKATLILRHAINAIKNAVVTPNALGTYDITLTAQKEDIESDVLLYPLMCPNKKTKLSSLMVFEDIVLEHLSEFYIIETADLTRMIKVVTTGIPANRDEAFFRSFMNPNQVLDCISFMLADSKKIYLTEKQLRQASNNIQHFGDTQHLSKVALYETLLKSAYDQPETFKDIKTFIESLPKDLLPAEFNSLYQEIVKASQTIKQ